MIGKERGTYDSYLSSDLEDYVKKGDRGENITIASSSNLRNYNVRTAIDQTRGKEMEVLGFC